MQFMHHLIDFNKINNVNLYNKELHDFKHRYLDKQTCLMTNIGNPTVRST